VGAQAACSTRRCSTHPLLLSLSARVHGVSDGSAGWQEGNTALHLAAISDSAEAAAALAEAGADLEAVDGSGWTALMRAAFEEHAGVVQRLLAATAAPATAAQHLDFWGAWRSAARSPLVVLRGAPAAAQIDADARTVTFKGSSTVCFQHSCAAGRCAYYEIRILQLPQAPQFGFVTSKFAPGVTDSDIGVGDDDQSWGVDGARCKRWFKAKELDVYDAKWQAGDVIGVACDLQRQQLLVSVNGNFSPPNGILFDLSSSPPSELFAAFSAQEGKVEYNFGEEGRELWHAAPSEAFAAVARVQR
jgi:hypothetical protein